MARTWYCNAYPDRVEELSNPSLGKAIALHHADCTELIPTGELGPAKTDGSPEMAAKFEADGIVGIYREDGVSHNAFARRVPTLS